jgi:uncharacterized BrkB/YihY/UPF0761 family membrane protein
VPDSPSSDKSVPTLATELWDLVRAYALQETVEPIKGLGRYVAFGVAGSLLMGLAVVMFAMSLLRALQTETDGWLDGWWSWAPYVITLVFCALVILIAVSRMSAKKARSK